MIRTLTKSILFALLFTGVSVLVLSMYLYRQTKRYSNTVYPNVYVNGTSFEGKSDKDIQTYYTPINKALGEKTFEIVYKETVATFSGEMIQLHYDTDTIAKQALLVGRSAHYPSRLLQQASALLNLNSYTFSYKPTYSLDTVHEFLTELEENYNIPAEDAKFQFTDGKVTEFKFEKNGQRINTEKTVKELQGYLEKTDYAQKSTTPQTFTVSDTVLKPNISLADINHLGIEEKIAEGKSNFTGSSAEREYNVLLAASRLHGVLIPPGEVFSYNRSVGDISRATGYKTAYVISNGRTVLGDGGGICQDSTTMFRAALNAGLPIIERHAHAYRVKYYENDSKAGLDATVYSPSIDFKFRNDTPAHILIQTVADPVNNLLTFELYGKKDGRKVELSEPVVYDFRPAPEPLYEDNPALPKGKVVQVDWAAGGAKSSFTYKVTMPDGTVTEDRTFYSNYRPWRAVYQVGTQ